MLSLRNLALSFAQHVLSVPLLALFLLCISGRLPLLGDYSFPIMVSIIFA